MFAQPVAGPGVRPPPSPSATGAASPGRNGPTPSPTSSSAAAARGEPDDGSRYYHHWVATLERLAAAKGLTDAPTLHTRKEAWADAYRHTPHGQPVVLREP